MAVEDLGVPDGRVEGYFALGTASLAVVGLSAAIGRDLHVRPATVGTLVTVFALVLALAAPAATIVLGRMCPKRALLLGLGLLVLGGAAAAIAPDYPTLCAARVLAGLGAAVFGPAASAAGSAIVPAEQRTRALATVFAGMTAASVLGVPLASSAGDALGWRGTMLGVAVLTAVAFALVARFLPGVEPEPPPPSGPSATRCVITVGPTGVTAANDGAARAGGPAGTGLGGLRDRLRPLRGQVTGQFRDGWFTLEARVPVERPRLGIDWSAATAPLLTLVAFFSLITYVNPATWSAGEQVELWLLSSLVISGLMIYLVVLRPARASAVLPVMGAVAAGALGLDQIGFEHASMIAATALFILPRRAGWPLFALCTVAGTWSQVRYTLQSGVWPGSGANTALILVLLVSQIRAQFLYWGAMRLGDLVRELKAASADLSEATLAVERARSGLHLRDRIGSSLFAIARHLDRARQGDHPEGEVSEALQLARDTSEQIRAIARQGFMISG